MLIAQPEIAPKFDEFLAGLRGSLNPSIDKDDAIEMLAEHLITKPVFDALFDNYSFLQSNPVSRIMQNMLDVLHDNALEKEQETLDKFYASVQERAKGIDNAEGKQKNCMNSSSKMRCQKKPNDWVSFIPPLKL